MIYQWGGGRCERLEFYGIGYRDTKMMDKILFITTDNGKDDRMWYSHLMDMDGF